MAAVTEQNLFAVCSKLMADDEPCGRAAVAVEGIGANRGPVCTMHSSDPNKDAVGFDREIQAILDGSSRYSRKNDFCDFSGFVFLTAKLGGTTFCREANFYSAWFMHKADFSRATFTKDVSFAYAAFDKGVRFSGATFEQSISFARAQFGRREPPAVVQPWTEIPSADFDGARFVKPADSSFFQVNNRRPDGLRARLVNCEELDKLDFTDVHWFMQYNRMVLLDELDIRVGYTRQPEIVAKAYRQLVNNFERARSYDLAEDCFIGAMEMKRLDHRKQTLGTLGRWLSTANLYRLLSNYGSSYGRAFLCLLLFLLLFALLFPAFGLRRASNAAENGIAVSETAVSWARALARPHRTAELWSTFEDGFWASLEAATFQKSPTLEPADRRGEHLRISEDIVIPGQLALFLLALRRRFRR